jgi:hypothetical protein
MNDSDNIPPARFCPECGQDISEAAAAGDAICPACGHRLDQGKSESARETERISRRTTWIYFWLLFIAAPATAGLTAMTRAIGLAFLVLVVGTLGAGFALAKLMTKNKGSFILAGILGIGLHRPNFFQNPLYRARMQDVKTKHLKKLARFERQMSAWVNRVRRAMAASVRETRKPDSRPARKAI